MWRGVAVGCRVAVAVGCRVKFGDFRAGKRQWPWGEAIDVWPWGACWLQEGWQTADLDAHKKPLMCGLGEKPLMYGPGVPVGCKRAGKRQTWMPIRSH